MSVAAQRHLEKAHVELTLAYTIIRTPELAVSIAELSVQISVLKRINDMSKT